MCLLKELENTRGTGFNIGLIYFLVLRTDHIFQIISWQNNVLETCVFLTVMLN